MRIRTLIEHLEAARHELALHHAKHAAASDATEHTFTAVAQIQAALQIAGMALPPECHYCGREVRWPRVKLRDPWGQPWGFAHVRCAENAEPSESDLERAAEDAANRLAREARALSDAGRP